MKSCLLTICCLLSPCAGAVAQEQPPRSGGQVRYWSRQWAFDDVSVQRLTERLDQIGLNLPVNLRGRFSAKLTIGVPWNDLRNPRSWRFGGALTSTQLVVDDFTLNNVDVVLNYRDGALKLDRLRLSLPPESASADRTGLVTGSASLQLLPQGDFSARLTVQDLPLSQLAGRLGIDRDVTGTLNGTLTANVPVNRIRNATAWKLKGPVSVAAVQVGDSQLINGSLQINLAEGLLTADALDVQTDSMRIGGGARLQIAGDQDWTLNSTVRVDRLGELLVLLAEFSGDTSLTGWSDRVTGTVAISLDAAGALSSSTQTLSGKAELTDVAVNWPDLVPEGIPVRPPGRLDSAKFDFRITDESLTVSDVAVALAGGRLTGNAVWPWKADGTLSAEAEWNGLQLAEITREPIGGGGPFSGRATVSVDRRQLSQPDKWNLSGNLQVAECTIFGWPMRQLRTGPFSIEDGALVLPRVAVNADGHPWNADLQVGLMRPWPLTGTYNVSAASLQRLAQVAGYESVATQLVGIGSVSGSLSGELADLQLSGKGHASADEVAYAGAKLQDLQFDYSVDRQALGISNLTATTDGDGTVTAHATLPFAVTLDGDVGGDWQAIDIARIASKWSPRPPSLEQIALQFGHGKPPSSGVGGAATSQTPNTVMKFALSGLSNGSADFKIPAGTLTDPSSWNGSARLEVPKLTVNSVSVAGVSATANQHQRKVTWKADGQVLNGQLAATGTRDHGIAGGTGATGAGELRITGADIEPLWRAWNVRDQSASLVSGPVSLRIPWKETVDQGLLWAAELRTGNLLVAQRSLSSEMRVRIAGTSDRLHVASASGDLAGGTVRMDRGWTYSPDEPRPLMVTARRLDLQRLLLLFPASDGLPISGPIDLKVQIQPGEPWRAAGTASGSGVNAAGLTLDNVSVPFSADWAPATGHLRMSLKGSRLAAARGRLQGDLTVEKSSSWSVDGEFRFHQLDLASLPGLSSSRFGRGRISGRLNVTGQRVRTVGDLTGSIVADLNDTQIRSAPILSQVQSLIPGVGGARQFETGHLNARFANGSMHVREASLAGPRMRIFVSGFVNSGGGLRLSAVVATGQPGSPVAAQLLLSRLAMAAFPPAAAVLLANDFVSNRVIYLAIGGTMSRPVVRIEPAQELQQQAVRFFLLQLTGQSGVPAARP